MSVVEVLLCFLSVIAAGATEAAPPSAPPPPPSPSPPPPSPSALPPPPPPSPPPLLLVSFDGFRADYLKRFPMPNLKSLYSEGVLVEQMTNVFVTKTFPNHYSLVTGLYAESHGVLASNMFDPDTRQSFHVGGNRNSSAPVWWSEAEPLWLTALDAGFTTAAVMWPGADVTIGNRTATHSFTYDAAMSFTERLGNVTRWLKEEGVKFAALYWEQPDAAGHKYGPENDTMMRLTLKEVDDAVGLMVSELQRAGLWGRINVIVTSDHGMTQCSSQRLIRLDECLSVDAYTLVDLTPVAALIPKHDVAAVFDRLKRCHPHMTAFLKASIPSRLHYRNNRRVPPVLLVADEGWTIVASGNVLPRLGDHGYDSSLPSMHPFLAAAGPSFRRGRRLSSIQSVDVYPLMCRLLGIEGRPHNGSLSHTRCLLLAESCWETPRAVALVLGVLLVLTTVTALFAFLGWKRPRSVPEFHRLDAEDTEEPLLE